MRWIGFSACVYFPKLLTPPYLKLIKAYLWAITFISSQCFYLEPQFSWIHFFKWNPNIPNWTLNQSFNIHLCTTNVIICKGFFIIAFNLKVFTTSNLIKFKLLIPERIRIMCSPCSLENLRRIVAAQSWVPNNIGKYLDSQFHIHKTSIFAIFQTLVSYLYGEREAYLSILQFNIWVTLSRSFFCGKILSLHNNYVNLSSCSWKNIW